MAQARFTPEALDDLEQLAQFIARDKLTGALEWLDRLQAACQRLASQPEIGERLQTRRLGEVRRHVVGNYVVYYLPETFGITVLTILHVAREHEPLV